MAQDSEWREPSESANEAHSFAEMREPDEPNEPKPYFGSFGSLRDLNRMNRVSIEHGSSVHGELAVQFTNVFFFADSDEHVNFYKDR